MDDPLAQLRGNPAARLYLSDNCIRFEVEGTVASTQMQDQRCVVIVRNDIGDTTVAVRKGACPDYYWRDLVYTRPYSSRMKIVGEISYSDFVPDGVETKIISLSKSRFFYPQLRGLTRSLRGEQLLKLDENILKYVKEYPQIKQADIFRKIRYENQTTIRKHLHKLVQSGKIKKESDGYMLIDYGFGSEVSALYSEFGWMSDASERTTPHGQSTSHEPKATNPLEMLHSCIDENVEYFKMLQAKLPECDFGSRTTILRHIFTYPEQLDEMIEDEIDYWNRPRYSIRDECTAVCSDILYQLRNSDSKEDVECILHYTVESMLEHILPADAEAQKLKYGNSTKNEQRSRMKELERKRKDGLDDLCCIQTKLKCRLDLGEFEKSLEKLQKKYQKLHSPSSSSRSKKPPKIRAAKRCPDLESRIAELINQDPGIQQRMIMEKFKPECPKTTIERRLKNLQIQNKIMRLPGHEARYVARECRYMQDMEKLLIFHIGRTVRYLEELKIKMQGYTNVVQLSILECMVRGHHEKMEEEIEGRAAMLENMFYEIDNCANETHRLLENNKYVAKKQKWAIIIDSMRLKQRKHRHDTIKLEADLHDRRNSEKMEQVSIQYQISCLAEQDVDADMRVIRLALKYESDPVVLERTLDEMHDRYMVQRATDVEGVINTMLDMEPQMFLTHRGLLDAIDTIKLRMNVSRTYRPHTIDESDGKQEFILPHTDSCIQARERYSKYRSMWDTIKKWRDAGTYDVVIAPLVDKAAILDTHHDISFSMYEE